MTTSDRPAPRPLRRDAQRNRDAIVEAARQVFCDHGLEAPLEQIARQAGVGIATLYRRFPNRAALLDAVLADTSKPTSTPPNRPWPPTTPGRGSPPTWNRAAGCRPPTAA